MKQLLYKVITKKGTLTLDPSTKETILNELENMSTSMTFIFDRIIPADNKLLILFVNGDTVKPYKLDRINNNRYSIAIPREVMKKGRLYFTVHHYDKDLVELAKYSPAGYLYINKSLDISADMMEIRPDLFAELYYKIQKLEEIVYKDNT
ncbi:hypothetical protein KHQ81_14945 [Mycoplasmatota bacterium]|nr:hypothetical protein KHQ81_14945 [Mycoplasmatota bacterium]